jgi:glycosyltransferase involved in cell wall biosynthesis
MRIVLVAHGFPPLERTGVENHVAELAAAFARAGHDVHVFAPRRHERLPELALRVEARDGYRVHWLARNEPPRSAADHLEVVGVERAFAAFLERERPDVVHVHHVAKLGLGVLAAAHRAGLPVVFTAHDHFAYCHRIVHSRPDLARCESVGDPAACARCDLAASELDRTHAFGDYQAGVLPAELDPKTRERLERALSDDLTSRRASAVLEARRQLDARRLAAFREVDLVLAPSAFLAERLVAAGLARERVAVEPLGVDVAALAGVERPRTAGALRLGYVGATSKHKGLHVLLAALDGLGPRVKLEIFGESGDRLWQTRLRALAEKVGAAWRGGFDASERGRVFSSFDVLCVPSIWEENAPLVVREAFAAGRPVLASRLGGLAESVRDGVDGVLVEPGSPEAWRAVLAGWIRERAPLAALTANVARPRELADEARATLERYERLLAERRPVRPTPASLGAFLAEHESVSRASFEELAERVARGLERWREFAGLASDSKHAGALGGASGGAPGGSGALTSQGFAAVVRSTSARDVLDRARDLRRERDWLARTLEHRQDASRELAKLAREKQALARTFEREHAALLAERDALAAAKVGADEALARASDELVRCASDRDAAFGALEACREEHRRTQEVVRAAVEDRRRVGEHVAWLERSLRELVQVSRVGESAAGASDDGGGLAEGFAAARERIAALARELAWRRDEMRGALGDRRGVFGAGALGARVERWRGAPEGER